MKKAFRYIETRFGIIERLPEKTSCNITSGLSHRNKSWMPKMIKEIGHQLWKKDCNYNRLWLSIFWALPGYRNVAHLCAIINHCSRWISIWAYRRAGFDLSCEFSALDHWGKECGLKLCGFHIPGHFLIGLVLRYLKSLKEKSSLEYFKKMLPIKHSWWYGEIF